MTEFTALYYDQGWRRISTKWEEHNFSHVDDTIGPVQWIEQRGLVKVQTIEVYKSRGRPTVISGGRRSPNSGNWCPLVAVFSRRGGKFERQPITLADRFDDAGEVYER